MSFTEAQGALVASIDAFHKTNPLVAGCNKEELRKKSRLGLEVFSAALEELVRAKKIEVLGEQVRAAGRAVAMDAAESKARAAIEQAFLTAGLKVPLLKDVLSALPVDKARAQKIVTLLLREGALVKLADELVFHRDALLQLKEKVKAQKSKTPRVSVPEFKDLFGITRKYAIPLLEYLDRERVTRREGDVRVIV